ncbi:glycosyltransferase family 4 protein [Chloroflexota bacterium]
MKILYVQDTNWISQNPIQHTHLAERLVLRRHEVRVIDHEVRWKTAGKKEVFSKRQVFQVARLHEGASVTVVRPPIMKIPVFDYASMVITYWREINRQIREFKPDILIGDCILTTYLGYRAARKHGIPTVYYVLDINHRLIPFKFLQSLGKLIESRNIGSADLVLAINKGLRGYTIQMGAEPGKAAVLTAGTDTKRFSQGADSRKIRKQYGINQDDLLLFFVGWIHHFNGLKEVAVEIARQGRPNIKLLVVGDGDGFNELQEVREKYGLHERFILAGRKPYEEIPQLLSAADICLLPAYPDEPIMQNIVPIKMYDYLAAGKPIIATKLPGIMKEFGEDSGIVYVDKPEDTVETALELAANNQIDEIGARATRFAEQHSWEKITDEFEAILKQLIESKTRNNKNTTNERG